VLEHKIWHYRNLCRSGTQGA